MPKPQFKRLSANRLALRIIKECAERKIPDKQIQERLERECHYTWTLDAIRKRRRSIMNNKQSIDIKDKPVDAPMMDVPPHGISGAAKAQWYRDQLVKTHLYATINKQFESDEVKIYLEEFGQLCCQFSDIVTSEFMQIDDFLKHRILINRQLILTRSLQREISDLNTWFTVHPKQENESKELIKYRILQQRQLDDKYKYLKVVNDRYDALVKERQRIYSSLAATRKDRLDELKGGKETFMELVATLQHSQAERDKQGKLAELTRIAAEDITQEFRKPVDFPDGTKDPIIIDESTDFGDIIDE